MVLHLMVPDVVIIKKVSADFIDEKGNKQPYFKLTVATSDDAGTLSCTPQVFEKAKEGQHMTIFIDSYDVIRPYKGNDSTKLKIIDIK